MQISWMRMGMNIFADHLAGEFHETQPPVARGNLHSMDRPIYRLFVLGAGFSAPAGLPLGEELLDLVRKDLRRYFRDFGWEGPLEEEIAEWTTLYPGRPIDLERVLAYSHRKHYLGLIGSEEYFNHGSRSIVAARRAIQEILIKATPMDTPQLFRDFAEELGPDDVVLTFNYDSLLEQALDDIGKPYSLTPQWWLKDDPAQFRPKYVDLIKLHGSIDWYDRFYLDESMAWHKEQGDQVPNEDPIFGPAPSVPSEPLSKGPTEIFGKNILSRVRRVPNHVEHFPIESRFGTVVPFILPPAQDKLLGNAPILDLWENLHRAHNEVSCIVVIGYSMPYYDTHAYEALGRLLVDYQDRTDATRWGHRRVPIQVITLADSRPLALKNVPFLDPLKTRVWDRGFSVDALKWVDWGTL